MTPVRADIVMGTLEPANTLPPIPDNKPSPVIPLSQAILEAVINYICCTSHTPVTLAKLCKHATDGGTFMIMTRLGSGSILCCISYIPANDLRQSSLVLDLFFSFSCTP